MPFQGQFADSHQAPRRKLDRLTPGEDGLDDIGRQEGELHRATDLARVDPIAASEFPGRTDLSSRQLVKPAVRLGQQGDQALIGRCDFPLPRKYNQLRLDTTAFEHRGDGEVDRVFRIRCGVRSFSEEQTTEPEAIERDMDRAGVKRDAVKKQVQKPTLALGPRIVEVIAGVVADFCS